MTELHPGLRNINVLQRGWLSSNNVVLRDPESGDAAVVDSGYVTYAAQTVLLVQHA